MVDRDGLENRCACKRTVGSNPTLSARNVVESTGYGGIDWLSPHLSPHSALDGCGSGRPEARGLNFFFAMCRATRRCMVLCSSPQTSPSNGC